MAGNIRAGNAFVEIGVLDRYSAPLLKAAARMKAFGSTTAGVGAAMMATGATMGAPLVGSGMIFAGFDQEMATVAAMSGATGASLDALRDKAKSLGATTSFSAIEAAQAMTALAKAGFSSEEILAGVGSVMDLAAASAIDLGTAADIAANIAAPFGIAADEIEKVNDLLALTANKSTTGVLELGESFKMVAPMAVAAGQSIEEMSAAFAALSSGNLKGTQAGTGLAAMLSTLTKSDKAEIFEKLGVATQDAAGNIRPLRDVMRDLGEATADMSMYDKNQVFGDLFGAEHAKSGLTLIQQIDKFDEMAGVMQNAKGAAKQMASAMLDSVVGSFEGMKGAIEGVAIEIGEALKGPLRTIMDFGASAFSAMTTMAAANPQIIQAFAAVTAAVVGIGGAMVGLGAVIGFAGSALGSLVGFVGMLIAPFTAMWAAIGGISGILGIFGSGLVALSSPALLIAAAIGAIVVVIGIMLAESGALSGVITSLTETMNGAVTSVVGFFTTLWNIVQTTFQGIRDAFAAGDLALAAQIAGQGIYAAFMEAFGGIINFFDDMITKLRGGLLEIVKLGVDLAQKIAAKLPGNLGGEYFANMAAELQATQDQLVANNQERKSTRNNAKEDLAALQAKAQEAKDAKNGEADALARTKALDEPAPMATEDTIWDSGSKLNAVNKKAAGAMEAIGGAALGTFSGFAAGLLGSARPAEERTAKATERTAKAAEQMVVELPKLKPQPQVFGA